MPRPPNKSSEELLNLARAIKSQRGNVTVPSLRQAAGGGSFHRLKGIVEMVEGSEQAGADAEIGAGHEERFEPEGGVMAVRPAPRSFGRSSAAQAQEDSGDLVRRLLSQLEILLQAHGRVMDLLQEDRQIRRLENEALARLIESQSRLIDQVCRMADVVINAVQIGLPRQAR